MKKSIKANYIYNISYQIFALIVPLITTPYISRVIGVEGIGINSYTYAMLRYFWLLSALGCATYGLRIIGISQEDRQERSLKFWSLFLLKIVLSSVAILLYVIYVLLYSKYKTIAFIQGIYLIAVMLDISWFYQGMEDFKKISIKNFIFKILNVIYIFMFVKSKDDLKIYIFGLAFFQLLSNLSLWMPLKKYVDKVKIKKLEVFKYLKPCLELFLPSVAAQIFAILDKSMIGWITNDSKENGYYEQALKIIDMSLTVITTLGTVKVPSIARDYKLRKNEKIKQSLNDSVRFTIFVGLPMMFGIWGISGKFVPIFFGEEYIKSTGVLNILSLLFIFMGVNSITGTQYLISSNQQNIHTKCLLVGGCFNFLFNWVLISRIGSYGAAIASVIGEIVICILESAYLYRTKQYNIFPVLLKTYKYIIASVLMFIYLLCIQRYIYNLIGILLAIVVAIIVYFVILMTLKDSFLCLEIRKYFDKRKNNRGKYENKNI